MVWDLDKMGAQGGSTEKVEFAKFPEGITRIRIVDETPFVRWTHWQTKHQKSINCPGYDCPICAIRKAEKANKITTHSHPIAKRFVLHVINRDTGNLEIMEQGKTFMEDVKDIMVELAQAGKKLSDVDLNVRRRGTDTNTTYRVDKGDETPLSDKDLEMLNRRVDFTEKFKPHAKEQILELLAGQKTWEEIFYDKEEQTQDTEESSPADVAEEIVLK